MRRASAIALLSASLVLAACQNTETTSDVNTATGDTVTSSSDSSVAATAFTGTRTTVDAENSQITFKGNSNIIDHDGEFETFTVTVTPDSATPADFQKATISAEIDMTSVTTDSDGLTGHLQKEDFFDVMNHPKATFESTSILQNADGTYDVMGNLTIKGITKTATFKTTVSDDGLTTTYDLPRKDFNVGNDAYGDKLLEDIVPVTVTVKFQ